MQTTDQGTPRVKFSDEFHSSLPFPDLAPITMSPSLVRGKPNARQEGNVTVGIPVSNPEVDIAWTFGLDEADNAPYFGTLYLEDIYDFDQARLRIGFRNTIDTELRDYIQASRYSMLEEQFQLFMRALGQRDYSLFVKKLDNRWTEVSFDQPIDLIDFCKNVITGRIDDNHHPQVAAIFNNR